jgi:hypothetical protein
MSDATADSKAFYKILQADTTLLTLLGWVSGDKGKFLQPQKYSGQVLQNKTLFFTFIADQPTRNDLCTRAVLQMEAHVPNSTTSAIYGAYDILTRAKTLIHKKTVNGHEVLKIGGEGQVLSAKDYIGVSNRYRYTLVI